MHVGFQAVFALCLLLQAMVLPDSPRWLLAHGRAEEASRILAQLAGAEFTPDHPEIARQRLEIETSLAQESAGGMPSAFVLMKEYSLY